MNKITLITWGFTSFEALQEIMNYKYLINNIYCKQVLLFSFTAVKSG